MPDLMIFMLGCLVTVMTVIAVVSIGIGEGRDVKMSGRHIDALHGVRRENERLAAGRQT